MRVVKELVLKPWQERMAEVTREATDTERRAKAVQQKLDRLDEAFLCAQSIDITTLGLIRFRGHVPKGGYDVPNAREP